MSKKWILVVAALVGLLLLPVGGAAGAQTPGVPAPGEENPEGCTTDPDLFPNSPPCVEVLPEPPVTPTQPRPQDTRPGRRPQVAGDAVTRGGALPRTGSELNGTAAAGGALTVLGVGLALAARKRRNAYEGS